MDIDNLSDFEIFDWGDDLYEIDMTDISENSSTMSVLNSKFNTKFDSELESVRSENSFTSYEIDKHDDITVVGTEGFTVVGTEDIIDTCILTSITSDVGFSSLMLNNFNTFNVENFSDNTFVENKKCVTKRSYKKRKVDASMESNMESSIGIKSIKPVKACKHITISKEFSMHTNSDTSDDSYTLDTSDNSNNSETSDTSDTSDNLDASQVFKSLNSKYCTFIEINDTYLNQSDKYKLTESKKIKPVYKRIKKINTTEYYPNLPEYACIHSKHNCEQCLITTLNAKCTHSNLFLNCTECYRDLYKCEHAIFNFKCNTCSEFTCKHKANKYLCGTCNLVCIHAIYIKDCDHCSKITIRKLCKPHGKYVSRCRECIESVLCMHSIKKIECKVCSNRYKCKHNRSIYYCTDCDKEEADNMLMLCMHSIPKKDCDTCHKFTMRQIKSGCYEHSNYQSTCTNCNRYKYCSEHVIYTPNCIECNRFKYCKEHNMYKSRCYECINQKICKHSIKKINCEICSKSRKCKHLKDKYYCRECFCESICKHSVTLMNCIECKTLIIKKGYAINPKELPKGSKKILEDSSESVIVESIELVKDKGAESLLQPKIKIYGKKKIDADCTCDGSSIYRLMCDHCVSKSTCMHTKYWKTCAKCKIACIHFNRRPDCLKCNLTCIHSKTLKDCLICTPKCTHSIPKHVCFTCRNIEV